MKKIEKIITGIFIGSIIIFSSLISSAQSKTAEINFIRKGKFAASAVKFNITIGDSVCSKIKNKSMIKIKLYQEGQTCVSALYKCANPTPLNCTIGEQIDIKIDSSYYYLLDVKPHLQEFEYFFTRLTKEEFEAIAIENEVVDFYSITDIYTNSIYKSDCDKVIHFRRNALHEKQ